MISINLMPLELRKKSFPIYKIYLAAIYFFLCIMLLLWAYNLFMFKYSESQLKKVNDSLGEMTVWQQRFQLNESQNAEITKRGVVINNLSESRILWSDSLADLGNVTPYGVWLTSVSQNSDKAHPNSIAIEGKALKMDYVLSFVHNLQQEPQIASVSLKGTKLNKQNTSTSNVMSIIEFSLTFDRVGGAVNAK